MDASGASSSSTAVDSINSSSVDYRCGVFINHRGPDTKKTFASYLYRRLLNHGLRPFLDQEELEVGSNFPTQIVGAIRSASVHVAIFSTSYANSPWCLRELVLMLESKAPIIPIFYHVDPAALRWTKGVYAEALNQLQMKKTVDPQTDEEKPRYDSATLQNWRNALSSVADTSGFDLMGKFNGDEGLLLDEVVKRVVEIMAKDTQLFVAKNPTGLNDKIKDFETTIFKQQHTGEVQVVGIVGLGGVGKTTLAKEFFNRNRKPSQYIKSYFLSDVRENARISLHSLQSKLMKGLFHLDLQIDNIHQGTEVLRQCLSSCKIFLILDDIDDVNQVDVLLADRSVLHKDSLILITSRDEGVLARSGVKESSMYRLTGLPYHHSQQLFCSYAFCQPYPHPGFQDLVNKFLMACDGLPLSLIVFGALLSAYNDKCDWEDILHQLELPKDIKNRLKVSYDALGKEEQQIFLDIACFFIGKNKNSTITVWHRSGWKGSLGLKNLQLRCLVTVDHNDVIHMHDHLRDLGREIAENELPRRLWRHTAGNVDDWLLQQSSVLAEARGIRLLPGGHGTEARGIRLLPGGHGTEQVGTSSQMLSWYQRNRQMLGNRLIKLRNSYRFLGFDVPNLQLVETEAHLLDRILRVPSPNLISLSWRDCPYTYLPSWITTKNLRVLRVEGSRLETLWQGQWQAPLQLEELEIFNTSGLLRIPKSIGHLKHLQRIVISSSFLAKFPEEIGHLNSLRALELHAGSLKSFPNSLGRLTNLHRLSLSMCYQLERLPDSFGSLTNLHSMNLFECKKMERLPDSFRSLTNLHSLYLTCCSQLERLPDSFGSLTNLHSLNMSECSQLERLPDSFGSLAKLHSLNMRECSQLERLPDSFGSLTNLHRLDLSKCKKLERLPDSFGSLTNLHSLNLMWCEKLERLSDSFGSLMNLHSVDLSNCSQLERLPDFFGSLTNLHSMQLSWCSQLERLPDSFGSVTNLHSMQLSWCSQLERLPDSIGSLTNLHSMHLTGCSQLERLPDSFGSLTRLEYFNAGGCANLTISTETFGNIRTLENIDLSDCGKVEVWPWQLGHQRSLKTLKLMGTNFKELPSVIELPSDLQVLWIENSLLETVMPSLGDLRKLKELHLLYRGELKCLPALLERPSQLSSLRVAGCPIIHTSEVLSDEVIYPNLSKLIIQECINLAEVGTLPKALRYVTLDRCYNLRSIEGLCGLQMLEYLHIEKCDELQELPLLKSLTHVWVVRLSSCSNLRSIEGLSGLSMLRELRIEKCNELQELPLLKELQKLRLSSCSNLRSIEGLCGLSMLREIHIEECNELQELPLLKELQELSQLRLSSCYNLRSIEGLSGLAMLLVLDIEKCKELRSIEGLCDLAMLQYLYIQKCNELQELRSLKTLVSLEFLRVTDCEKLKSIRDLAHLPKLGALKVWGCPELEKVEGVEYCRSLRSFDVKGCHKLRLGERAVERLRQKCIYSFKLEEPNRNRNRNQN